MSDKKSFKRLPLNVLPKSYDLFLKPNLKTPVFEGRVVIQVMINEATDIIVLNSLELVIKSAEVTVTNDISLKPEINLLEKDETLVLKFQNILPLGNASIRLDFTGIHNDIMKGFYRTKFQGTNGKEKYNVVTLFEATDARRCFPCWDEPAFKAVFKIKLAVPEGKVALSNMPISSSSIEASGDRIIQFETTPMMSTYLVAVAVGEFDYVEDRSSDGVLVRVYTPVGKKEQGKFALYVATKVLPYYKDYFKIGYPLPKLDLIAVGDSSFGAMENWGLVTYRESCLLVDSTNTAALMKQIVALIVGHELAHQWFGNLVTMEWWTHLWLNEGFASFIEFLCVAHIFPEYDIWTQFTTDTYIRALELDCLKNSHPIEVPVGHPSEISEVFDGISYNKGASVIRMLHNYIGDKDFRKGLNIYLTKFQFKNTCTEDLWTALEDASAKPVEAVMSTWTKQMGFPVISIDSSKQEGNNRILTISQRKFCADGSIDNNSHWLVPLAFSKSGNTSEICKEVLLDSKTTTVTINNVEPSDFVKVNPGTIGFYRTKYPSSMLEQFIPAIEDKSLPPLDRLGILDDLFAMVQAGLSSSVEVLKLMESMTKEDNYTVWCSISNCLLKLKVLLSNTDFEEHFNAFGCKLFKHLWDQLDWEPKPNESHFDTILRALVLNMLGGFGDKDVIKQSQKRFKDHASGKSLINADLRSAVYRNVSSVGNEETYNMLLKIYHKTDLHEEQERICRSFGAQKDANILRKVLEFSISDKVRSQDTVSIIISVANSKIGRNLAWDFIKANWNILLERYKGGFFISKLLKCFSGFASEEKAAEIENFFAIHTCPGAERALQQTCESIRLNMAWLERDCDTLQKYLMKFEA